jgi:hypothetical protein
VLVDLPAIDHRIARNLLHLCGEAHAFVSLLGGANSGVSEDFHGGFVYPCSKQGHRAFQAPLATFYIKRVDKLFSLVNSV